MRLSETIEKNVFVGGVGGLLNSFKIKKRRDVLIFVDIIAEYIKYCEEKGHSDKTKKIAHHWLFNYLDSFTPSVLKNVPPKLLIERVMKPNWVNVGILDDLSFEDNGDTVVLTTKNEGISKIIGPNKFSVGMFQAVIEWLYTRCFELENLSDTEGTLVYEFKKIDSKPMNYKSRNDYSEHNKVPDTKGFALKHALKSGLLKLNGSRLFFRGHLMYPIENTLFHLLGNEILFPNELANISKAYFSELIHTKSFDQGLVLLKTLLEVCGWGKARIIRDDKKIVVRLDFLPYGSQLTPQNYSFIAFVTLGFLQVFGDLSAPAITQEKNHAIFSFNRPQK